jgi:tetratricopeptide (TPR) repeat protein
MTRKSATLVITGLLTTAMMAAEADLPAVEDCIPAAVRTLAEPAMIEFPGGIGMAVSASTYQAQARVLQGINHLHGGWEFEASRHFAAALREDPECLLAHWGMVVCLLHPMPETLDARMAACERMFALIERGAGTELERGYAYGLVKFLEEGPAAAANAFRKVSTRFPNDPQSAVFAAVFSRGGFDDSGEPTPDQEQARNALLALVEKQPDSHVPLNALLLIHAEAPDPQTALPHARRLAAMMPDYPPAAHLAGHYEWRCGNHAAAAAAFTRATSLYQKWMRDGGIPLADCPEWIKAEGYRIVAMASLGQDEAARAAAATLAATPDIDDRPSSAGNRMLLWEAKSLPARLAVASRAIAEQAASSLPPPTQTAAYRKHSLASWWIDGLRILFEARRLLESDDPDGARDVLAALDHHCASMARTRAAAVKNGEISMWTRGLRGLEMLGAELRGDIAMAGPPGRRGTAYNWFSSAADRQRPATLLLPPVVPTPMAARLGEYHMDHGKPDEAVAAYQRALAAFPNHRLTLAGLLKACEAAGRTGDAAEAAQMIEALGQQ